MADIDHRLQNMSLQDKIRFLNRLKGDKEEEIKNLEEKKKKEAEQIEAEILEALKDVSLEEQKEFLEQEEQRKKRLSSLEQSLENVEVKSSQKEAVFDIYSAANTNTPPSFYDLTNYNIYSRVKDLAERAESGNISPEERNFLSGVTYNINRIRREEPYDTIKRNDSSNYLSRTSSLLEKLDLDLNRFRL